MELKRRDVLAGGLLALLGGAAGLYALDDEDGGGREADAGTTPGTPTPDDPPLLSEGNHMPFDVWEEIRTALRTSPDHLPARADALVEAGDPGAIFDFVRDEFVTLPAYSSQMGDVTRDVQWGVRGTLRGGQGTVREKGDLLVDLYERAGYEAELLVGGFGLGPEKGKELLWRPIEHRFEPDIGEEQLADWYDRMGLERGSTPSVDVLDPEGAEREAVVASIRAGLPPVEHRRPSPFRFGAGQLLVRVVADGQEHYGNLVDVARPFGDPGVDPQYLSPAPEASEPDDLEVTLSAAVATSHDEPFELVSGRWSVDELVGRQLLVQTLPGIDAFDRPETRYRDVRSFVPALTLQGVDLSQAEMEASTMMGEAVTRSGHRLAVADDGTVLKNGDPVVGPEPSAAAEDVESLSVSADATRFPEVTLAVDALDADGEHVGGLPATAFGLADEDAPVGFEMLANEAAPRVHILSDNSGSMPQEYRFEAMTELVGQIKAAIREDHPDARISHDFTESQTWTRTAEAVATDANVIVYITDGQVNDKPTEEIRTVLATAPPVVFVNVYDEIGQYLSPLVEAAGGVQIPVSETDEAIATIKGFVDEAADAFPTYEFVYGAPTDERAERTARVTLIGPDADVSDTGTYTPPAERITPPHLSGLYLTVTRGHREVTRTLAGWDPALDYRRPVTQEMIDEVSGVLFGNAVLSVEAGAPPFSVWADDFLAAKGSVREIDAALVTGEDDPLAVARENGVLSIPPELFLLAAPLPDAVAEDAITFQLGVRVTLYRDHPVFGEKYFGVHGDILPLTRYATAMDDPEAGFQRTLDRTAHLAVVENALFETTTARLLDGKELQWFRGDLEPLDGTEDYRWRLHEQRSEGWAQDLALVPADGEPHAFWSVDHQTGGVLGVLPDGSGGGSYEQGVGQWLAEFDKVMSRYNVLLAFAGRAGVVTGPGGFALGLVALYGQLLARLYGVAALAVGLMDASMVEEQVARALASFACNVAKALFFGAILNAEYFTLIDDLIGAFGGNSPVSCPG